MRNFRAATNYGVAITATAGIPNIVRIRDFGLPVPQAIYRPFQAVYSRGDITRAGDGPISCEWVWEVLYLERVGALMQYLFASETAQSASVYIRTGKQVGWWPKPEQAFATFSAIAWRPLLYGPDGAYNRESPYEVDALRLMFKNMVEII
jgi:hypothetical protein